MAPPPIPALLTHPATLAFARVMVTMPFWAAGLYKLVDFPGGTAEMAHAGLHPPALFNAAVLALEIGASVLVILNRWTWLAAGALGVFTVLATAIVHVPRLLAEPLTFFSANTLFEHAAMAAAFILVAALSLHSRELGQ